MRTQLENAGIVVASEELLRGAVDLMRERITFAKDMVDSAAYFFEPPATYHEKTVRKKWKADAVEMVKEFTGQLAGLEWQAAPLHDAFKAFVEAKEVGMGKLMAPLRLALTGAAGGPGLFETMELLGREECQARLQQAFVALPV